MLNILWNTQGIPYSKIKVVFIIFMYIHNFQNLYCCFLSKYSMFQKLEKHIDFLIYFNFHARYSIFKKNVKLCLCRGILLTIYELNLFSVIFFEYSCYFLHSKKYDYHQVLLFSWNILFGQISNAMIFD